MNNFIQLLCIVFTIFSSVTVCVSEDRLCLSNICIGDDITKVADNVEWYDITNNQYYKKDEKKLQEVMNKGKFNNELKETFNSLSIEGSLNFENFNFDVNGFMKIAPSLTMGHFDKNTISNLKYILSCCKVFELDGTFYSKSGHLTIVKIMPFITQDNSSIYFKIVKIIRYFGVNSDEELEKIESMIKTELPTVKRLNSCNSKQPCNVIWNNHPSDIFSSSLKAKSKIIGTVELLSSDYMLKDGKGSIQFVEDMSKPLKNQSFCQNKLKKLSVD